jgi:hypothetical protein
LDAKGNFVNGLDIRGSVAGENLSPRLRIDQTAPGRYEGEFEANEQGQYMVALRYTDEQGTPRIYTVGAAVPYSPEYRDLQGNSAVLSSVADRTKGQTFPTLTARPPETDYPRMWRHNQRAHSSPQDLWPLLILFGALLLPVDIAVRRLLVSRSEWVAIGGMAYGATLGRLFSRRSATAEREEGTGRLLGAKARASRRLGTTAEEAAAAPVEETVSTPPPAPSAPEPPQRPTYEGPVRTMPTVSGAGAVAPPSAPEGSRPTEPRPDLEMARPAEPAPPAPEPTRAETPAPPAQPASPAQPAQPAAPPPAAPKPPATPAAPSVIWHKPVEGVGSKPPATPAPSSSSEKAPEPPGEGDSESTSRLLRAKRRAKDKQE